MKNTILIVIALIAAIISTGIMTAIVLMTPNDVAHGRPAEFFGILSERTDADYLQVTNLQNGTEIIPGIIMAGGLGGGGGTQLI